MEQFEPIEKTAPKKKKKRSTTGFVIIILMLCLITMTSLLVAIYSLKLYKDEIDAKNAIPEEEPEITYTQAEVDSMVEAAREEELSLADAKVKAKIKEVAEKNDGVLSALRELYPEYFVYYENGGYVFKDINPDFKPANFQNEGLIGNEGFIEYKVDGEVLSVKGIDVSKFQGEIDWQKVADSGVKYAMIRLGLRGYETGKLVTDENFEANIQGALDAGLEVGVYFFTQAITEAEAREEAEYVLEAIAPYNVTFPVAIDVEDLYNDKARSYGQTKESRTSCAIAFMDAINAAGYRGTIYGNLNTFSKLVELDDLGNYEKWFAQYDSNIYFPYEITMWQYSDKGSIDGIEGDVDLNITFPKQ